MDTGDSSERRSSLKTSPPRSSAIRPTWRTLWSSPLVLRTLAAWLSRDRKAFQNRRPLMGTQALLEYQRIWVEGLNRGAVDGLILDRVVGGKVQERWEQWDQSIMLQQLGLA